MASKGVESTRHQDEQPECYNQELKDAIMNSIVEKCTILIPSVRQENDCIFATKAWEEICNKLQQKNLSISTDPACLSVTLKGDKKSLPWAEMEVRRYFEGKQSQKHVILNGPKALLCFIKNFLCEECKVIEKSLQQQDYSVNLEISEKFGIVYEGGNEGLEKVKIMLSKLVLEKIYQKEVSFSGCAGKLLQSPYGKVYIKGLESRNGVVMDVLDESKPDWWKCGVSFDQRNFQTKEGLIVSWKHGCIESEKADILVNSANSDLNQPTTCGKALSEVGGKDFIEACRSHTNILPGEIVHTTGGKLECKYVIHAVCTNWEPNKEDSSKMVFNSLLRKILHRSTTLGATTLAMPFLGTGKHKFPKHIVSEILENEIRRYSESDVSGTLKEIRIMDFEEQRSDASGRRGSSRCSKKAAYTVAFENVSVCLQNGDITTYPADAIINLWSTEQQLLKRLRSFERIKTTGGFKIQKELDSYSALLPGSIVATSAGLLTNSQLILHILVTTSMLRDIRSPIERCLEIAVSRGVRSVTIDPGDSCALSEVLLTTAQNLASRQHLQVNILPSNGNTFVACKKLMRNFVKKKKSTRGYFGNNPGLQKHKSSKEQLMQRKNIKQLGTDCTTGVEVRIFSLSLESNEEALNALHRFISYNVVTEEVQVTNLSKETCEEYSEVSVMARKHNVDILLRSPGVVSLSGRPQDVSMCKEEILKLCSCGSNGLQDTVVPEHWDEQPAGKVVHVVSLSPRSEEYQKVRTHVNQNGGSTINVLGVQRIQNPSLFAAYCVKKESLRGRENEKQLFHGTKEEAVDRINTNNFDRSFVKEGVCYGDGVYFAEEASYAMDFCPVNKTGHRFMYLARVLVGRFTNGYEHQKSPPLVDDPNNPGLLFDSLVNDINDPTIFVIFNDVQCYPEYLIKFT